MVVILLGPPGVGKGTQGVRLAKHLGWRHVATGDLLRGHRHRGTDLGRRAQILMDRGELVPDDVILGMVEHLLASMGEGEGVVFDGFPRTVPQAEAFTQLMERSHFELRAVVVLEADDETLTRRLSGRRSCPSCSAVYSVFSNPPKVESRCDRCGHDLIQRTDDEEETVRHRLRVYHEETEPVARHFEGRGDPVKHVSGEGSVEAVQRAVLAAIGEPEAGVLEPSAPSAKLDP